jgi:hypothetical protein
MNLYFYQNYIPVPPFPRQKILAFRRIFDDELIASVHFCIEIIVTRTNNTKHELHELMLRSVKFYETQNWFVFYVTVLSTWHLTQLHAVHTELSGAHCRARSARAGRALPHVEPVSAHTSAHVCVHPQEAGRVVLDNNL